MLGADKGPPRPLLPASKGDEVIIEIGAKDDVVGGVEEAILPLD